LFTGIIEEIGKIRAINRGYQTASLVITATQIAPALKIGESVAVNGVCLTTTEQRTDMFSCDLSSETLSRTSLTQAKEGMYVNLERSLMVGGRLGGHMVQGHVDGMGNLVSTVQSGAGRVMEFSFPRELARYLVHKGSIAVDGISLTIASLDRQSFKVAVIPHTLQATNLQYLKTGDPVNLEVDLLAKYFERFFQLGLMESRPSRSAVDLLWEEGS
jgi:riboflavin synthase